MKTGILTFHDGINHGAFLQAFALQKVLQQLGYPNQILNYKNRTFARRELRTILFRRDPIMILRYIRKIQSFRRDQRQFVMTPRCSTRRRLQTMHFDQVVVGSDSVWNYSSYLIGFDPAYFSEGITAQRIISYAASFGPDSPGDNYPEAIPRLMRTFYALSVRDENSRKFVHHLTGKDARLVLDPTLLYDFQPHIPPPFQGRNYVLVYSLGLPKATLTRLRQEAHRRGKTLISIGYRNRGCDRNLISPGPFSWLAWLQHADLVVTSMYHGTVLSLQLQRPFICCVTPYRANKIRSILSLAGLEDRILEESRLSAQFDTSPEWESMNTRINLARQESLQFLKDNLLNA